MNHESSNQALEKVFEQARQELPAEEFTATVVAQTGKTRRFRILWRGVFALALALVAVPLERAVEPLAETMLTSLIDLPEGWLSFALAPINSIGTLLSVSLLGLWAVYRRYFG